MGVTVSVLVLVGVSVYVGVFVNVWEVVGDIVGVNLIKAAPQAYPYDSYTSNPYTDAPKSYVDASTLQPGVICIRAPENPLVPTEVKAGAGIPAPFSVMLPTAASGQTTSTKLYVKILPGVTAL